jgi:oligosaccharide repeat unit polymerase
MWLLRLDKKYLLLVGVYILLFLSIGDRGAGMQVTFTFLVLFGALVRPVSLKEFSFIIVVGAIILTLIGLGRSSTSGENILISGANKAEFQSGYDVTMELAKSARTLYSALSDVPEHHDYFWGKLWLGKFLAVIPLSQNVYLQLTDDKPYELGSGGYITYLRYGVKPPSGEGTSLIADIYLNFGLIGVIFFMFLLGLFFKKVQNELNQQKNYYWIITAALLASGAFYMGRGGLFDLLRPILWGFILATLFVKKKKIMK